MTADALDYPLMVQQALRGVVRRSLRSVAARGLPGEHHFYLAFSTSAPGVSISPELLRQYPEQMTIVLQHDYRDLNVEDDLFSVTLRFAGVPQRLHVPFAALLSFYDPAAQFALRFEPDEDSEAGGGGSRDGGADGRATVRAVLAAADRLEAEKEAEKEAARGEDGDGEAQPVSANLGAKRSPPAVARIGNDADGAELSQPPASDEEDGEADSADSETGAGKDHGFAKLKDVAEPAARPEQRDAADAVDPAPDGDEGEESSAGSNVVSIEAFRRK
ncbi:MAG: ClpXP protease specificity-enhancing factor SspB [Acidobacteriota bacterium]